ncbi:hypothetical protein PoB_002781000 [Plakobranchus ocellatus]|uniref:Uncharacterized protein n=1 Tax=Plakobranchus ocellatus TaxID=259542 RepID=A0AAV4A337_9GAST|nr:hypothetical protein PoB_002781000 [Plakobranchus ocellatus]
MFSNNARSGQMEVFSNNSLGCSVTTQDQVKWKSFPSYSGMFSNNARSVHNKLISGFQALPSGQGADGGARTRNRRVPADLRANSLATVPPKLKVWKTEDIDVFLTRVGNGLEGIGT